METTVYKPVERNEQSPETAAISETTFEKVEAAEDQQPEKKPEPQYEWADRSLQDLLPKNQKAEQTTEKMPQQQLEEQPEQAEVTVYRTTDQQQPSKEVAETASAEVYEEIHGEDTGKGGSPIFAEQPVMETETLAETPPKPTARNKK